MFSDYVLEIPYGGSHINFNIDDTMYLVEPDIMINDSEMTKFVFHVGEIKLVIIKNR